MYFYGELKCFFETTSGSLRPIFCIIFLNFTDPREGVIMKYIFFPSWWFLLRILWCPNDNTMRKAIFFNIYWRNICFSMFKFYDTKVSKNFLPNSIFFAIFEYDESFVTYVFLKKCTGASIIKKSRNIVLKDIHSKKIRNIKIY